ncbi:unnamed protein product [Rhizoctonia solani]|uniref:Uncharacterized protein n=1 Tax=Rhizoctonia solani TaxID=456999 RepID=A0A8H3BYA8_9AGAM|nr:unnamed protein product [Rhizoctonia solani]
MFGYINGPQVTYQLQTSLHDALSSHTIFSMRMSLALALALSASVLGAPAPAAESSSSTTKDPSTTSSMSHGPSPTTDSSYPSPTVPYASDDLNESFLNKFKDELPEPIRGSKGAKILGPQNVEIDRQNPDLLAPPTTDSGSV